MQYCLSVCTVAFMQFSQSVYSQSENTSPLIVRLVLDPFGGTNSPSITQDIVANIAASVQPSDTATGKGSSQNYYSIEIALIRLCICTSSAV